MIKRTLTVAAVTMLRALSAPTTSGAVVKLSLAGAQCEVRHSVRNPWANSVEERPPAATAGVTEDGCLYRSSGASG